MWQDYAIMTIQWAFAVALVPALRGEAKPDRRTCAMTGGLLYALAAIFATLGLWAAVASSAVVANLWAALLIQQVRRGA